MLSRYESIGIWDGTIQINAEASNLRLQPIHLHTFLILCAKPGFTLRS